MVVVLVTNHHALAGSCIVDSCSSPCGFQSMELKLCTILSSLGLLDSVVSFGGLCGRRWILKRPVHLIAPASTRKGLVATSVVKLNETRSITFNSFRRGNRQMY